MDLEQLKVLIDNEYVINDYCSGKALLKLDNTILDIDRFCIPKRQKELGYRIIYKPMAESLINCLKILNTHLNQVYRPSVSANGFVKGRGIKSNAEKHLAKKYILGIDIRNFFETITDGMIVETLEQHGFDSTIALSISKIVTINGFLVQGFHTSPTLANMIFNKLDLIFEQLDDNITYSRYADDLTFSSDAEIKLLPEIIKIIEEAGFSINERKSKIMKRGQNQYVTGLTVFDNQYPRIAKRIKKKLRLEVYYINKYGLRNHTLKKFNVNWRDFFGDPVVRKKIESAENDIHDYIYGWLVFINGIEPKFAEKCFALLRTKKIDTN
ncbi:reverse transcriptase family protein [Flavobacterium sp. DGU11]|uniref:RNA-directed DNA polymerase n=1 Tax=Flavobacterium arundinis TaxID=3139143 RepID=A0ABU9HRK9_9FLAO